MDLIQKLNSAVVNTVASRYFVREDETGLFLDTDGKLTGNAPFSVKVWCAETQVLADVHVANLKLTGVTVIMVPRFVPVVLPAPVP